MGRVGDGKSTLQGTYQRGEKVPVTTPLGIHDENRQGKETIGGGQSNVISPKRITLEIGEPRETPHKGEHSLGGNAPSKVTDLII